MKDQEGQRMKETFDQLVNYLNDRFTFFRLEMAEKFAKEMASAVSDIILMLIGTLFFFFLSFTLGFLLAEQMGSMAAGFGTITGAYLLLFFLFLLLRKPLLEHPLIDRTIKRVFQKEDD